MRVRDPCESALAENQVGLLHGGGGRKWRRKSQDAPIVGVGYEEVAGAGIDRQPRGITKAGCRWLPGKRLGRRIRYTVVIADGGLQVGFADDDIRLYTRSHLACVCEA